jgi:hypothetical protein
MKLLNDFAIVLEWLHNSVLQQQPVPLKLSRWVDLHLFLVHKPSGAEERIKTESRFVDVFNF